MANTLTFANQTLTDANIFGGINYIADLNTGEEFTIGNTASASVSFVTDTQLPVYTKDAVNGTFTWTQDGVSRGRYYITEATKSAGMYNVTAYDAMILLDTSISALSITFPATASALASLIATYLGCTVSGTINNGTLSVEELDDMPIRQLLSYIAEVSGCSVKIDGSDHLVFCYYADSGITLTASDYKNLEVADYTCSAIDKVVIFNRAGLIQAEAGIGDNTLYIKGANPFFDNVGNTVASTILSQVSGFVYAPLTCELFSEEGLEIGTIATFGTVSTLVMHIESTEDGTTVSSVGSDSRAEYNKDITDLLNEVTLIAQDAQAEAAETKQHFWFTSTDTGGGAGVHITETTKDAFEQNPTGGNLLARSNGIAVRDGLTELATFGANGARIGQSSEQHIDIDSESVAISDGSNTLLDITGTNTQYVNTGNLDFIPTSDDATCRISGGRTTITDSIASAYISLSAHIQDGNSASVMVESQSDGTGKVELSGDLFASLSAVASSGTDHDLYTALTELGWGSIWASSRLNLKKLFTKILTALKDVRIVTGSTTDTTQSGWILLKYNGSNISASQYDVISAGCDGSGRLTIPFVSGGIWYVEIATYTGGTLKSIANTSVTVSYTLRKR